jgi:hypothetical protein
VVVAAIGSALSWAIVEKPILDRAHRVAASLRRKPTVDPLIVGSSATP